MVFYSVAAVAVVAVAEGVEFGGGARELDEANWCWVEWGWSGEMGVALMGI